MTMSITPENEKILADAVKSGRFNSQEEVLAEALRLLRDQNEEEEAEPNSAMLPVEKWQRLFEVHLASTPKTKTVFVDDSRETIYEGRGE